MVKKALIERLKCPFCGSKNLKLIYKKNYLSEDIKNFLKEHLYRFPLKILKKKNFEVLECLNCTGIFQKYILNKFYTKKFYEKYVPHKIAFNKKKKLTNYFRKVYNYEYSLVKKYFKNKKRKIKVLEIGAGWGHWLLNINKNKDFSITAVEISETRRKFLIKNKIKTFSSINLIKGKFDFIFSDQTFEHLSEPFLSLKKITKNLKVGGIIYLKVPPGIFIKKKLTKNYIVGDDEIIPLEHINVFNKLVNSTLAKNLGLKYLYPLNPYSFFSLDYFKKLIVNFYEYHSSKTIIFQNIKK